MINPTFYTNYNQAMSLKKLGFNDACFTYYFNEGSKIDVYTPNKGSNPMIKNEEITLNHACTAPTLDEALEFLRLKFGYDSLPYEGSRIKIQLTFLLHLYL